jgi:class 3 adenylate cyclase/pimeloyl-ACP methyl ester carboxylesterase
MEPRIQYAKTSDGVSIAYTVLGSGDETLICVPNIWGDLQMYKSLPVIRAWWDPLAARGRRVFLYDSRNIGSSEHRDLDYSEASFMTDLEGVIERSGAERFSLYGFIHGCATATRYALAEPDRVERLVLVNPFARGNDFYTAVPEMAMTQRLGAETPEEENIYYKSMANIILGFSDPTYADHVAEMIRTSMSPEEVRAFTDATRQAETTDLLSELKLPALVLHMRRLFPALLPLVQEVARLIPNAEFSEIGGRAEERTTATTEWVGLDLVDGFLHGDTSRDEARPSERATARTQTAAGAAKTGTATILFADIVDSTALTEKMGDAAFREKARQLDGELREVIRGAGGTPIEGKLLGDGVLATFASARQAIEAALACTKAGDEGGLPLHVGLHAGDVISEEGNVFGGAVNVAARISGESAAGEVLVSQTVRDLARTSAEVSFEDCGERELKGVGEPVRVWRVLRQAQNERKV